jgi:plasmid segregation protein ParM
MKLIGLDVGYGFVKVTDGNVGYTFPSVIGEGGSFQDILSFRKDTNKIENLRIEYKNKAYNVGEAAIKHSNYLYRDMSLSRSYGDDFSILFITALSLFHNGYENQFRVVTGLPPERMHLSREIRDVLKGEHMVSVYENGEPKKITINIADVAIIPQPIGTFWAEYSQKIMDSKEIEQGKIGVVDIGFGTSDFAVIEDQEYIPGKSITVSIGMSMAYKEISKAILTEYGIAKQSHSLDEYIIKGKLKKAGTTYDITGLLDRCYERLAQNILVEINSSWSVDEFDKILFTGGGINALDKFLIPKFAQGIKVSDPFIANSLGYYSWGENIWS